MIDANTTIVFKRLPEIIPEGELSLETRMQRPKCVDVAKFEKTAILGAWLGLDGAGILDRSEPDVLGARACSIRLILVFRPRSRSDRGQA